MNNIENKANLLSNHIDNLVSYFIFSQNSSVVECPDNINKQEMKVIEILGRKDICIMSELAENMMIAVSTLTGIIDNMVSKNYVSRERSGTDRRIIHIKLTTLGKEVFNICHENHLQMSRFILNSLNPKEQEEILSLFGKISNNILMNSSKALVNK